MKFSPEAQFLPIGEENIDRWTEALEEIYRRNIDRASFAPENPKFDAAVGTEIMMQRYAKLWESET